MPKKPGKSRSSKAAKNRTAAKLQNQFLANSEGALKCISVMDEFGRPKELDQETAELCFGCHSY